MTTATPSALEPTANPGLAPFDITGYKGVRGQNFFELDTILKRIVKEEASALDAGHAGDMDRHLSDFGALVGGILDELAIEAHKEGKYGELVKFDKTGERIDEIRYCTEQKEIRRICYEHGIVNLDFHPEWKHPFTTTHRMALAYLMNLDGEAGITCPLAMTDGL
ncbi:MAG: acyl-CoA dehydrogenase, partial [Spirochaetia bacterium]|nr:acyl-CoA dehydrogenase [Spirochaetia bacterium]